MPSPIIILILVLMGCHTYIDDRQPLHMLVCLKGRHRLSLLLSSSGCCFFISRLWLLRHASLLATYIDSMFTTSLSLSLLIRVDDVDDCGSEFLVSVTLAQFSNIGTNASWLAGLTGWLQAGASHEESVHVWLLGQILAVLLADATAVDHPGVVRRLRRDLVSQPLADGGVDFLSLGSGRDFAGADGPGSC